MASFAASERPVPLPVGAEEEGLRLRKSVMRKWVLGEACMVPWAWERGHRLRVGTAEWRAFREACSHWGVLV